MHEQSTTPFPSCFTVNTGGGPPAPARPGQSLAAAVYRASVAGRLRHVTVTWCRDVLVSGLSVAVEGSEEDADEENGGGGRCKVEVRPWQFWRRQGAKRFRVDGEMVEVMWDLRSAKSAAGGRDPEPRSGYYVAVVSKGEVALLVGDLQKEALRKSGCRPSLSGAPSLVSRTEHLFGKRRFSTRARFHGKGRLHDISIEFATATDPEMVIWVDGQVLVHVKHLQWTFRGNQSVAVKKGKLDVYWNVHGWLFGDGSSHAVFMFKPASSTSRIEEEGGGGREGGGGGSSEFCLFLYAWKVE